MKNLKKVLALIVVAMMLLASVGALAATVEIKTSDKYVADRTFKAYKVFNANWEGSKLTNITAGDGIDWNKVNWTSVQGIGGNFSSVDSATKLIEALNGATVANGEKIAKVLKDAVDTTKAITVTDKGELGDGYYIIIDETTLGNNDMRNAALLQVAGDKVTINVKTDKPSVDKVIDAATDADTSNDAQITVKSNNGQINDYVPYIITSTVPTTTYYDKYYMEFDDTLSKGLTYDGTEGTTVVVTLVDNSNSPATETVLEEGTDKDYVLDVTQPSGSTETTSIKVKVKNVKGQDGKVIKITYKAKINEKAIVGTTGNPNEVTLKYTNNPDHSGDGDYDKDDYTSVTPKEVAITYLTKIELVKVDANNTSTKLEGAVFSLDGTRTVSTVVTEQGFKESASGTYYKLSDGSYTTTVPGSAGAPENDQYDSIETRYEKATVTTTKTETNNVLVQGTTDGEGNLVFNDLGAGTYTIHEITAPTGYNLLSSDIVFTIGFTGPNTVSTGTETCTWSKSAVSGVDDNKVVLNNGVFTITVGNAGGSTLPSTGGIGTTIFYVAGSILVLAAAILLITKRRMGSND